MLAGDYLEQSFLCVNRLFPVILPSLWTEQKHASTTMDANLSYTPTVPE